MLFLNYWKCLIPWRRLPNSISFTLKFDKGRLTEVKIYEILSLAIDFANLILKALSYFKNRKRYGWSRHASLKALTQPFSGFIGIINPL